MTMNKLLLTVALPTWCGAATMPPEADQRLAHDIYKEMIEIKSGVMTGATTPVAQTVAARCGRGITGFRHLSGWAGGA
jgi:hypothetical protein